MLQRLFVLILVFAIATNVTVNLRFNELANHFPFIGVAVWVAILISVPLRRPDWEILPETFKGSLFLLSLVSCASMMPVEQLPPASALVALGLGFVSAIFDNIPLTALALKQGGYDWGFLAYAVGFGGLMIWFGSSAGVALSNMYPEARSVARWLRHGWHVALAYVIGFAVMYTVLGWHPDQGHKKSAASVRIESVAPTSTTSPPVSCRPRRVSTSPKPATSALALASGLECVLDKSQHDRVIVFRPLYAVGGQELGYLPGDQHEKMSPWGQAVFDALGSIAHKNVVEEVLARDMLEVLPLTHIRGRSLHDAFVIVDEAQSLERNVLLTVLSRIGQNSRVVLTHDIAQRDNLRVGRHDGVVAVIEKLKGHPLFAHVTLTRSERSPIAALVTEMLENIQL